MSKQHDGWWPYQGSTFGYNVRQHCWMRGGQVLSDDEALTIWSSMVPKRAEYDPLALVREDGEVEEKVYPDIDSAQETLDRGETVQIAMEPFEIDPALVRLAQSMQDRESLVAFFERLGEDV